MLFQLHVMDSSGRDVIPCEQPGVLSTPCNGFINDEIGVRFTTETTFNSM